MDNGKLIATLSNKQPSPFGDEKSKQMHNGKA